MTAAFSHTVDADLRAVDGGVVPGLGGLDDDVPLVLPANARHLLTADWFRRQDFRPLSPTGSC